MRRFIYSFDNLCSLPNIDDWCALSRLKEENLIPENAVFVPGHTGDFITGGHLHYVLRKKPVTKETLINSILHKHYGLWEQELQKPKVRASLAESIEQCLEKLF